MRKERQEETKTIRKETRIMKMGRGKGKGSSGEEQKEKKNELFK